MGKTLRFFWNLNNEKEFFSLVFDFFKRYFSRIYFICFGKRSEQNNIEIFGEAQKECLICIRVKSKDTKAIHKLRHEFFLL